MKSWQKIAYSTGSLGSALTYNAVQTYAVFFYASVMHVPIELIGIAMLIYGIWNSINDPLFGYLSDRTNTKWGRRLPFMAIGLLPLVVVFALLWAPPVRFLGEGYIGLLLYFAVMMFLFEGLFTIVILNWTSLFPEMFETLKDRATVSMWRQLFGNLGLVFGIALTPMVYDAIGWQNMGMFYGVITASALTLAIIGVRKGKKVEVSEPLNIYKAIKYTMKNKSFLTYVLSSMFIQFTFVLIMAAIPFYAEYVLKITPTEQTLVLGSVFLVVFATLAPWRWCTVRFGPKNTMSLAIAVFALALIPFGLATNLTYAIIGGMFLGVGLAGLMLILDILLADVIDEDSINTGMRREGMYFGSNALFIRLGVSAQALVLSQMLSAFGYDPQLPAQPEALDLGVRLLVSAIPIAALFAAFIIIQNYPLYGEKLEKIKDILKPS